MACFFEGQVKEGSGFLWPIFDLSDSGSYSWQVPTSATVGDTYIGEVTATAEGFTYVGKWVPLAPDWQYNVEVTVVPAPGALILGVLGLGTSLVTLMRKRRTLV